MRVRKYLLEKNSLVQGRKHEDMFEWLNCWYYLEVKYCKSDCGHARVIISINMKDEWVIVYGPKILAW